MSVNLLTPLDDLTVLEARGPDTVRFLQGQLSQDLRLLAERGYLLAGLHNPQGRCLAVLRLLQPGTEQVLMVLPAQLSQDVLGLLSRYVLRAKVRVTDASSGWRVYGLAGGSAAQGAGAGAGAGLHVPLDAQGQRQLLIAPRSEPAPSGTPSDRNSWRLADIASGLPEILTATSGLFVAQMLNLDLLDGISFNKGCYTGQEIIARAHYRGQVKRRMQRFVTASATPLEPGARVQLADGRGAQVVMAAVTPAGGQEFLAVAPLATDAHEPSPGTPADTQGPLLAATPLSLPYL